MSHLRWVHEGPYARFQKRISGLPTEDQTPYGQTRSYGRRQENPLQGGMSPRRVRFRYREKTGLAIEMLNDHHMERAGKEEAAERQRNYDIVHRKGLQKGSDGHKLAGSEVRAKTARDRRAEYGRAAIGDDGGDDSEDYDDGQIDGTSSDAGVGCGDAEDGAQSGGRSSSRAEPMARATSASSALSAGRAVAEAAATASAAASGGYSRSRQLQPRPTSPPGGRLEPVAAAGTVALDAAARWDDSGGGGNGSRRDGSSRDANAGASEGEPRDTEATRAYAKAVLSGDKFVIERASRSKAELTELAEQQDDDDAAADDDAANADALSAAGPGHRNRFDVLLDEPRGTEEVEALLRLCKSSSDPAQVRALAREIRAGEKRRLAEQQEALPRHLRRPIPEFPAGGVLNARCATGYPPLVIAAARDNYDSVPVLVAAGALPDVRLTRKQQRVARRAAWRGVVCACIPLPNGADVFCSVGVTA
jgi:hypothetical protein